MQMPWLPSLNLGVCQLDDEHRHLFEVMEELGSSITAGNLSGLRVLLDELRTVTLEHFRGEEAMMVRYGYPDTAAHIAEHARVRAALAALGRYLHEERMELFADALAEFSAAYFHGVLIHDGLFGRFLRDRGLEGAAPSRHPGPTITASHPPQATP